MTPIYCTFLFYDVAQRAESDIIRTVRVTMVSSSIPPPAKAYSSNRRFEIPQLRLPFSKSDCTVNVQCSDQNRSCLLSINFQCCSKIEQSNWPKWTCLTKCFVCKEIIDARITAYLRSRRCVSVANDSMVMTIFQYSDSEKMRTIVSRANHAPAISSKDKNWKRAHIRSEQQLKIEKRS